MISTGRPARAEQQVLGHRSASFTPTVYGHLFEDDLDALAASVDPVSRRTGRPAHPARRS
jgi:integrase